jgi:hypothetical protein
MRDPSGSTEGSAGVVLLVPEALGETPDLTGLRRTLAGSQRPARVLLCLIGTAGHELVATVAELGLDFQILVAAAAQPAIKQLCLRALPGMSADDQNEFALALSDVVLVGSESDASSLTRTATKLGKAVTVLGDPLPLLAPVADVTKGLDPESSNWRFLSSISGRLQQAMIEVLSFASHGWSRADRAASWRRLLRCVRPGWRATTYFAPYDWQVLSPDRAAIVSGTPIVASFEAMDRSALQGSFLHRDIVWLGAVFTICAAVAGYAFPQNAVRLEILEFATLLAVGFAVFGIRLGNLKERWGACRFGAEELRIARMSLPLLVLPPALTTADTPPAGDHDIGDLLKLRALAQVKRAVRDQGLPQLDPAFNPKRAAQWLDLIVSDQLAYNRYNGRRLERVQDRLRRLTQVIFAIAVIALVVHLIELFKSSQHQSNSLQLSGAALALSAALHGAGTRLGIVPRAVVSQEAERELARIDGALATFLMAPNDTPGAWRDVRRLAVEASETIGRAI